MAEESVCALIENDLHKLVTSLEGESLAFRLYQAKECRQKGDFNKAMLRVSEIVRDHRHLWQYPGSGRTGQNNI